MHDTVKSLWFIQLYVYRISCNTSFISTYGGFLKWGYPQIIHFNRILIRLSIINHPAIGVPPFMETSISNHIWLVVSTHLKNMSSSVGMMTFPTEWKVIKLMFQTTNQLGTSMIIGMIMYYSYKIHQNTSKDSSDAIGVVIWPQPAPKNCRWENPTDSRHHLRDGTSDANPQVATPVCAFF